MRTRELIKKWKSNQRYTLRLLEAMPIEQYDFKPIEGVKTYRSQVSHVTTWLRTNARHLTGREMEKSNGKTPGELAALLNECFDEVLAFLANAEENALQETVSMWFGKVSKEYLLSTMDNHLSHHRGQLIVYLRLQGVTPPSYVGW